MNLKTIVEIEDIIGRSIGYYVTINFPDSSYMETKIVGSSVRVCNMYMSYESVYDQKKSANRVYEYVISCLREKINKVGSGAAKYEGPK